MNEWHDFGILGKGGLGYYLIKIKCGKSSHIKGVLNKIFINLSFDVIAETFC